MSHDKANLILTFMHHLSLHNSTPRPACRAGTNKNPRSKIKEDIMEIIHSATGHRCLKS